jgi:L-fucose isomerase-like protein
VLGKPSDPAVMFRLKSHLKAALALAELRRSPIGLIGYRAPGFFPSTFDELLLRRRLGVAIEHIGLNEFTAALETAPRRHAPRDTLPAIEGGVLPQPVVARIERNYAALLSVLGRSGLRVFAMKDWPELFDAETPGGLWPALGWVQAEGYSIAPEGDVSGAVTLSLEESMTGSPAFFTDISVLDEPSSTLTLWHYAAPESLAKSADQVRYGSEGREVQFTLAPGQATLARVGHYRGDLRLLTISVEVLDVPTRLRRAGAVVRTTRTPAGQVIAHMLDHGWDHHVCLAYGDQVEAFRAIGKLTGIPVESI